jgi:hypothetical protein
VSVLDLENPDFEGDVIDSCRICTIDYVRLLANFILTLRPVVFSGALGDDSDYVGSCSTKLTF